MATDRLAPIIRTAIDRLASVAAASGYFGAVLRHEPKSAPRGGLTFATWVGDIRPIPGQSGLDATTARLFIMCRVYSNMLAEPQDEIDTDLAVASSYLLTELTADFGVDGAYLDLLGAHGDPVQTLMGYVELDRSMFRIADTFAPFIAPDVFDQEV